MPDRYSRLSIYIHWLVAVLMVFMLTIGEDLMEDEGSSLGRSAHASIGIFILGFLLLRVLWRAANPAPALPATMKPWEKTLSHAVHGLLYLLMLIIPLSGLFAFAGLVAEHPNTADTSFLGLFTIPVLAWFPGWDFKEFHEIAANAAKVLVILHIAAALKHQFWDKDNLLARMRP